MSFGFSIGDFFSGINLLRNFIRTLEGVHNGPEQLGQVATELRGLILALEQVQLRYHDLDERIYRDAFSRVTNGSQDAINDFLKHLDPSQKRLMLLEGREGPSLPLMALRKVNWQCAEAELNSLHARISAHTRTINILLVT